MFDALAEGIEDARSRIVIGASPNTKSGRTGPCWMPACRSFSISAGNNASKALFVVALLWKQRVKIRHAIGSSAQTVAVHLAPGIVTPHFRMRRDQVARLRTADIAGLKKAAVASPRDFTFLISKAPPACGLLVKIHLLFSAEMNSVISFGQRPSELIDCFSILAAQIIRAFRIQKLLRGFPGRAPCLFRKPGKKKA